MALWQLGIWSTLVQVMAWCLIMHQAITWTSYDLSSLSSCGIHLLAILKELLNTPIIEMCLNIMDYFHISQESVGGGWVGGGGVLKWWPPSTMWVGPLIYIFMAITGDVWIIPSFRIWDYVLHVEHVSCVITNINCGQHQWAIPSPLSIAL